MIKSKAAVLGLCMLMILRGIECFAEGERPWAFSIGATEGFDDNRDGSANNKESNFETRIVPRADYKLYRDRFDFDFYYAPQLLLRSNPRDVAGWSQKSMELYHDIGLDVVHRLSERLVLKGAEDFTLSDMPADMDASRTFHEFVNYWVNRVNASATYEVLPERSSVTVSGSHLLKKYQDDIFANIGDEKSSGAGISSRYMLRSGWIVLGDISYNTSDLGESRSGLSRSDDVVFWGVGVERVFGLWSARMRVGADTSSFDVSGVATGIGTVVWSGSSTEPGGEFEVGYTSDSGMTRVGFTAAYHTIRSDITPFATQQRTSVEVNAGHSFSERVRLGLEGVYARGEYSSAPGVQGGSDAVAGMSATLTYAWDRNLSLEATYRFEDWKADDNIRESYRRNLGGLGLKAQF